MRKKDKILGTLYGQAIGDAMGMPSELWPVQKIKEQFKGKITDFADGPQNNEIALNYKRGQYTDDTNQAFAILNSLIETNWKPNQRNLVVHLEAWANEVGAWENNILGPSSKAALTAIRQGKNAKEITAQALTNGAGMRISPIGALFEPNQMQDLVKMVYEITRITHSSDVAISGACMIAGAVTAALADYSWNEIVEYSLEANDLGFKLGAPTWAAHTHERLTLAISIANEYRSDAAGFCTAIYNVVGTGTMISESIPAAVAIAYYTRKVKECALLCANLGGDTDTIGAMATAICGAKEGLSSIEPEWIKLIDDQNPQHNLKAYADQIIIFNSK